MSVGHTEWLVRVVNDYDQARFEEALTRQLNDLERDGWSVYTLSVYTLHVNNGPRYSATAVFRKLFAVACDHCECVHAPPKCKEVGA